MGSFIDFHGEIYLQQRHLPQRNVDVSMQGGVVVVTVQQ